MIDDFFHLLELADKLVFSISINFDFQKMFLNVYVYNLVLYMSAFTG